MCELVEVSVRLQKAVRERRTGRRAARQEFFEALETASGGSVARAVDLLGEVAEEAGLPMSLRETVVMMAAVATWRELSGREDMLLRPLMLSGSRAAGLGRRLGIRLFRRYRSAGLGRLLDAPLLRMKRDSGQARRSLTEMRRRWRTVRRLLAGRPAAGFS